ncbi:MAG: hypothetical protein P1V36_00555 [Planctomycetota bacterium]|nr:hypothetical protein [Planctomycetota bacterium]
MRTLARPLLSILLVVLVTTWGICPCTMASALGLGPGDAVGAEGEAAGVAASTTSPTPPLTCCCKRMAPPARESDGETPPEDECPCCKRGGWMRDLPDQVQTVALEAPGLATFDLPLLVATYAHPQPTPVRVLRDTGPPTCWRPHASPVGIVRLLS